MTYEKIKNDPTLKIYIDCANKSLAALGFTEHSFPHVTLVSKRAGEILSSLGYDERTCELARIAGYLHDIGNLINRTDHSQSGAIMAMSILKEQGFPPEEIAQIVSAIGNHDEGTGTPVDAISAALILADKSDVRRQRVRNKEVESFDIHDRVNFSVTRSDLIICREKKEITLDLNIDTSISSVMEYFTIFLQRMNLCKSAAEKLEMKFKLIINSQALI